MRESPLLNKARKLLPMATKKGLEPSTFAVTGRRSNQLSYLAKNVLYQTHGRGGGTRTPDPMLPKHVRYQLRYTP